MKPRRPPARAAGELEGFMVNCVIEKGATSGRSKLPVIEIGCPDGKVRKVRVGDKLVVFVRARNHRPLRGPGEPFWNDGERWVYTIGRSKDS